jgi:acyl-CoA synthetase (AMP-forming)/AMP-acid ligase II
MSFVQRPLLWLQAISKYRARTSGGPDFAFELCSQRIKPEQAATLDLSSWSVAYNGADTILQSTVERFCKSFAPAGFRREAFFNCYGLAEASLFVAGGPKGLGPKYQGVVRERLGVGEIGATQPGTENAFLVGCGAPAQDELVLIVDPVTRLPVSAGHVGEIWVSGANVAPRYWNDDTASQALHATLSGLGALAPDSEQASVAQHARFLRTGDLGFLREDNQLFVTGRIKDLIIVEGRNHYPQDFEATVRRLSPAFVPGGGAAVSYRDELGTCVAIVQEVHGTETEQTLTQMIRRAIAEEHDVTVHRVVLVRRGTLPKTSSGKMQRSLVRDLLLKQELVLPSSS